MSLALQAAHLYQPVFGIAPMVIGAILGAASGLIKSQREQQNAKKEAELAATTARYSPWTGMKPNIPGMVNPEADVLEGAALGAAQGQKYKDSKSADQASHNLMLTDTGQTTADGGQVFTDKDGNMKVVKDNNAMLANNPNGVTWADLLINKNNTDNQPRRLG